MKREVQKPIDGTGLLVVTHRCSGYRVSVVYLIENAPFEEYSLEPWISVIVPVVVTVFPEKFKCRLKLIGFVDVDRVPV